MLRILIVEDSDDLRFLLKTELEWAGCEVELATDGRTGIELAWQTRPDVIVSDITLPGIDGLEFIRRVREIPELHRVPAIALTGLAATPEIRRELTRHFSAYLVKPVDLPKLCEVIHQLAGKTVLRKAG